MGAYEQWKKYGYLGYIGDEILPSYVWIIITHSKDACQTASIMKSKAVFFVPHMCEGQKSLYG